MTASPMSLLNIFIVSFLALLSTSEARPRRNAVPNEPRAASANYSGYDVPLSDGTQSLPPPNSTIKAITLGRGTQNYTCTPNTTAPVAIGALAELLDVSPLLPFLPPIEGMEILEILPRYLVDFDIATISNATIPVLGHHYFNAAGQPTFNLGSVGFLTGKKVGDIPAPANASAGPYDQGYGAVDWLALADAGGSVGISEAFRVETAGGKPQPSCDGFVGSIEVQYAALYWFYQE